MRLVSCEAYEPYFFYGNLKTLASQFQNSCIAVPNLLHRSSKPLASQFQTSCIVVPKFSIAVSNVFPCGFK